MSRKPWTPDQIPESFWQAIAAADGDRDQYLALLKNFHVLAHPEKTPRERPNRRGLGFFGAIGQAYYQLFGEELDL